MISWSQIDERLRSEGLRSLTVRKADVAHPRDAGAVRSVGLPRGQSSDWRFPPRADCSGLHVSEFSGVWDAHVDAKSPSCDLLGHVRADVVPAVVRGLKAAGQIMSELWRREPVTAQHRIAGVAVPSCRAALVLVGTDYDDPLSATIDSVTGNLGWSHVYLDPCMRFDGAQRTIIDFDVRRGVHWSTDAAYVHRRRARVHLEVRDASEILGCVRARVRQPFSVESFGIDESLNCVGMIVGCLPWTMHERLRELQVGPCISPNTLAAYYGVT